MEMEVPSHHDSADHFDTGVTGKLTPLHTVDTDR